MASAYGKCQLVVGQIDGKNKVRKFTNTGVVDWCKQKYQGKAGRRVDFSTNGTRAIGHSYAKKKKQKKKQQQQKESLTLNFYHMQILFQNGS